MPRFNVSAAAPTAVPARMLAVSCAPSDARSAAVGTVPARSAIISAHCEPVV